MNDFLDTTSPLVYDNDAKRRCGAIMSFGALRQWKRWKKAVDTFNDCKDACRFWPQLAGRELLLKLHTPGTGKAPENIKTFLKTHGPADDISFLDIYTHAKYSFALFPLATCNNAPHAALLMLVDNHNKELDAHHDHREELERTCEHTSSSLLDSRVLVYILTSLPSDTRTQRFTGTSWMLAYSLARDVLDRESNTTQICAALARDWISTGGVQGDDKRITHVEIANKHDLADYNSDRSWLIPENTRDQDTFLSHIDKRVFRVNTCKQALSRVTGMTVYNTSPSPWPRDRTILHSFCSRAIGPFIASLLLTRPETIVLWHTDSKNESMDYADQSEVIVEKIKKSGLLNQNTAVQRKQISSTRITEACEQLKETIDSTNTAKTIMHITQGNFLMKTAAVLLSELKDYQNLYYVYRDKTCEDDSFILLTRENDKTLLTSQCYPGEDGANNLEAVKEAMNMHLNKDAHEKIQGSPRTLHPAIEKILSGIRTT